MAEKARKKSKKVRNLIIGLVVLLLLAAALVVLLLTTSAPEEEAESSAYESTLVDLVVSEADDINELTVENAEGGFDIIRVSEATEDEDAVYGIEELESFLTDESELSSIIDQFANVSAMRLIEENAPDIAKYGLDDPTYVVTTYYDDGTTHTFTVGDTLPTDNGAYMMIDDDPNVYSMGDTKMSRLDYTALDFMDLNVIDEWESYTDDDGNDQLYIPSGKCILTAPAAGRTCYGAVSQVEQADGEFHTYAGRRVPKYVSSAEGNTRTLTISSRPLLIPNNKNPWIVADVLTD